MNRMLQSLALLTLILIVGCADSETTTVRKHPQAGTTTPDSQFTGDPSMTNSVLPDATVTDTNALVNGVASNAVTGTPNPFATPTPVPVAPPRDLPYGTPVPGKPGFVTSPHSPTAGYVDVRGFPPGSEVKDPYSGKIFLVP